MTNTQQQASQPTSHEPARTRAVAYYRSTGGEHERSADGEDARWIREQRDQVRRWAEEHGVTIIREFVDHGRNAYCREYRPAFQQLLCWIVQRNDFDYVLCPDVSRWNRFKKTDAGLALCAEHGKHLIFIAGQSLGPLRSAERSRAAQRSRELSQQILRGFHENS